MVPALFALFERYTKQTGVQVNFNHSGVEGRFAPEVETTAYRIVQENAQRAWDTATPFRDLLAAAAPELDLDTVFDTRAYTQHVDRIVGRLDALS